MKTEIKAFTLIELLIVIGIISILSSGVIIAVNPSRQFKLARDSKRTTDINAILNAIGQNMSENMGIFTCGENTPDFPASDLSIGTSGFDLSSCLVPNFLSKIPIDPNKEGVYFNSDSDYKSGYSIAVDSNGRINIKADSELNSSKPIIATR